MDRKTDRSQTKQNGSWKRPVLIVICIILAVALVILLAAVGVVNHYLRKIDRAGEADRYTLSAEDQQKLEEQEREEQGDGATAPVKNENEITWASDPTALVGKEENLINILLIGQDRRPGEGRARSDAMILCTINKEKKTITMTSFLRDLYVQIPGYQDTRMNAAYALGGMELLDETLMVNFGVHVDANVEVDFEAFQSVVDVMGGVDISLTEAEANYLNNSNSDWYFTAGLSHLNGEQALTYSRIRYLDSDFFRTDRQRNVITSLIENVRDADLDHLLGLVNTLLPMIRTDMTDGQIVRYAMDLFPILADCTLGSQRIPTDDGFEYATVRGMSVIIPYLDVNRQFLLDTLS